MIEYEYRQNKKITREEAFRECGVPYAYLDEVMEFLERREPVSLSSLTRGEFKEYEDLSRKVLLSSYRNPSVSRYGLRLPDVMMALPDRDIRKAKRILSYIEKVNEMEMSSGIKDGDTEHHLRLAMDLPEDQRNVLGMMESLGIGLYTARKLMAIMDSMGKAGYKASGVKVKEFHEAKGPISLEDTRQVPVAPPLKKPSSPVQREKELYDRFYAQEKGAEPTKVDVDQLKDRRCLFHGALATSQCPSCGTLLCEECLASGKCPRCKVTLDKAQAGKGTKGESKPDRGKALPLDHEGGPERESRDWERL